MRQKCTRTLRTILKKPTDKDIQNVRDKQLGVNLENIEGSDKETQNGY